MSKFPPETEKVLSMFAKKRAAFYCSPSHLIVPTVFFLCVKRGKKKKMIDVSDTHSL